MSLTCCDFYIIPLSFYLVKYFLKFFSNICTFLINALSSINISIRYRFYFVKYFCKYFLGPLGPVYIVPIYSTALYIACQLVFLKSFLFSCLCFFLLYIRAILSRHIFPYIFCLFPYIYVDCFFCIKKAGHFDLLFFFLLRIQYFTFSLSIFSSSSSSLFIVSSISIFLISVFFSGYDIHSSVFISNR